MQGIHINKKRVPPLPHSFITLFSLYLYPIIITDSLSTLLTQLLLLIYPPSFILQFIQNPKQPIKKEKKGKKGKKREKRDTPKATMKGYIQTCLLALAAVALGQTGLSDLPDCSVRTPYFVLFLFYLLGRPV